MDLFPGLKGSEIISQLGDSLAALAKQHAELAAKNTPDDRMQALKIWQKMSGLYWDILFAVIEAKIKKMQKPAPLSFDESERLFIDFGAVNILPRHKDFDINKALSSSCKNIGGIFPVMTFSDYIIESWAAINGFDMPAPIIGSTLAERVNILNNNLKQAQAVRDEAFINAIDKYLPTTPLDARKLISELDNYFMTYLKVSMRFPEYREAPEEARKAMAQDRHKYIEAERSLLMLISSAVKLQENAMPIPEFDKLALLHANTKIIAQKILYSANDVKKIARRVKKITDNCSGMTLQMRRGELKAMLIKKKEYLTVPAKTARCDASLFAPEDNAPLDYAKNYARLEQLCGYDMEMFNVPRVRMYGLPRVIFVPGQGLGTYDWNDHSILIPVFPVGGTGNMGGADKSLSYALGTYRWDSDEDRKIKTPYEQQIKDNKKKSIIELAVSFYKDYFLWLTKEKAGYRILPRETHKVFNVMFAPKKEEE